MKGLLKQVETKMSYTFHKHDKDLGEKKKKKKILDTFGRHREDGFISFKHGVTYLALIVTRRRAAFVKPAGRNFWTEQLSFRSLTLCMLDICRAVFSPSPRG